MEVENPKIEAAEMAFFQLPEYIRRAVDVDFVNKYKEHPDLPFYGLLPRFGHPRILAVKHTNKQKDKFIYIAYINKEVVN